MAKLDVAVSEGDDWLRDQRREEKSYSLRMAFDNTLSSITVEHHQACDAQTVREMHHIDCDARALAEHSRSGTSYAQENSGEDKEQVKKLAAAKAAKGCGFGAVLFVIGVILLVNELEFGFIPILGAVVIFIVSISQVAKHSK